MARLEDKAMTSIINQFIDKGLHEIEQPPPTTQHQLPIISYMVIQYMGISEISQNYTGFGKSIAYSP